MADSAEKKSSAAKSAVKKTVAKKTTTKKRSTKKATSKKDATKATQKLVIVESPAKAKTIGRILGTEYKVLASMGHIRDLPDRTLGVDLKNNFEPKYVEAKSRAKVIKELKAVAKKSSDIYLAPDPDREGEAIAWHLQEILKNASDASFHRVTFHEITKSAVSKAFEKPFDVNMDRVNAQQARRILDRLVGYKVSPLLWSQIERGISAGRVQSVALKIVCERERQILAFEPKEYWNFLVNLEAHDKGSGKEFEAKLAKIDGKKFEIDNEVDATEALNAIKGADYEIDSVEVKPMKKNPYPPFITSTLQQAASSNLNMSASFSMRIAQQLYEGIDMGNGPQGLITYMRTDSVNVAQEAIAACREYVNSALGPDYVPTKPRYYKSKSNAQEAHEAIRPTDVTLTPDMVKNYLDESQLKLYTLIWKRFVASQMASAKQMRTTIEVLAKGTDSRDYTFRTTVTVTTFQGYLKVYKLGDTEDDKFVNPVLAELKKGDVCYLKDANNEQKFTEPPARFSEASLIKELEANGIGRPSTYASIVGTIQTREYVTKEKGRLIPSELGFRVNDFLCATLPELFQVTFTAKMEGQLDEIEAGEVLWTDMMHKFYDRFAEWLEVAKAIGAPETEKATSLIELLSTVEKWSEPVKRGRRTYDDEKFFTSIKDKFEKDGKITEKQWHTLLRLAVTYREQLPALDDVASKFNFTDDLDKMKIEETERAKKAEESKASAQDLNSYKTIFDAFKKVDDENLWDEPVKRGRYTYDDKKFFHSLKQQADTGKRLTEKQLAALQRSVLKYKEHIDNFDEVIKLIEAGSGVSAEPVEKDPAVQKMLDFLGSIKEWAEPVKKGRRVYDDKAFYESIDSQFNSNRQLSSRQVGALKKLVTKYMKKLELLEESEL